MENRGLEPDLNRHIIVIDKPAGPTSFQVSHFVKKQLNLDKSGHFGTLDPAVTGVLPVALGRAVKLAGYFSKQDKEYTGIMHFHGDISREKVEEAIKKKFLGKIMQLPPVKSRVKRQEREREIKSFKILEQEERDFLFHVECQAGTYIRKLVHDLGLELGINAHMTELRRTRASVFLESQVVNLYDFSKAVAEHNSGKPEMLMKMLVPIEIITKVFPEVEVKAEALEKLYHGSPLLRSMIEKYASFKKEESIAIVSNKILIEIAKAETDSKDLELLDKQTVAAKPETVFN